MTSALAHRQTRSRIPLRSGDLVEGAAGSARSGKPGVAGDQYRVKSFGQGHVGGVVRSWLESLTDRDFGRADFLVGLLAEHAATLGEPYARHLGGKVRELRFSLLRQQPRVTYWLAPARPVVLLTVFRKTRSAETKEVERAMRAQRTCEESHGLAHTAYEREGS